ncbi:GFA family protein [Frigidibacter sp. MR17.24]|uniref:GFA family protein n=1 Tax=Frigidibacter sp. MR17.24 TaxID=3127345 RepID=UPI003012F766
MTGAPAVLRGGCLCGAAGFEVADDFGYALNCHCSQCRRATGAACKPFAGIARAALRPVQGEGVLRVNGAPDGAHDVFCGACGSLLWSVVREGAFVHVPLGVLIDPPSIRPQAHIFTGSKAPWHEITDALPQFEGFPD